MTEKDQILKDVVIKAIVEGLKQKLIIMPKFVERELPDYKLVPKEKEFEVPVPKRVEKSYEVPVPVIKKVIEEVVIPVPKKVERPYEVPVPKLKYYSVETFRPEEVNRIREIIDKLPKVLELLEKVVKFVPREVPYEVKVPEIKKVPYPVDVPDYKLTTVLRPHFQDIKILHPVLVEQIMTLEEWRKLSTSEREKIGEIVKSQLRVKKDK